jgi:hypothetical protein
MVQFKMTADERDGGGWCSPGSRPVKRPAKTSVLLLGMALLGYPSALATPRFHASEIEGPGSELVICDLDGDHYQDIVLINGLNLLVFYQDPVLGFQKQPNQRHSLGQQPAFIWPAKLGREAASLLVMTHSGVSELWFTNRTAPPTETQIIQQATVLPASMEEPTLSYFPCSANHGSGWPLVLVPVEKGLQVWQHRQTWNQTQTLDQTVDAQVWPEPRRPGYTCWTRLSLSLGDLNHDQRDDLIVRHDLVTGKQIYNFYRQNADGVFTAEPALTTEEKPDRNTWRCWVDINQDQKTDLLKCTWLNEAWFLPGSRSGKVLVGVYFADHQGRIPDEPQQVFRKNDWMAALPVVDVDGDGYLDLVLGHSEFDSREGIRKMITAKQLDFSLNFHFYHPTTGFPKAPDFQRRLIIHLDQHSLHLTWSRREYFERYVNLAGDFNGDGKRDLLVKDRSSQVSVYFFISRRKGFSQEPDVKFGCPEPIDRFEVADLNGDGVSDLIIKFKSQPNPRIYTSEHK